MSVDVAADDFVHVAHAVAADEIDADIEHVRAFAHLVAGHAETRPSQSSSCSRRLNWREPLVLVRSATIR